MNRHCLALHQYVLFGPLGLQIFCVNEQEVPRYCQWMATYIAFPSWSRHPALGYAQGAQLLQSHRFLPKMADHFFVPAFIGYYVTCSSDEAGQLSLSH